MCQSLNITVLNVTRRLKRSSIRKRKTPRVLHVEKFQLERYQLFLQQVPFVPGVPKILDLAERPESGALRSQHVQTRKPPHIHSKRLARDINCDLLPENAKAIQPPPGCLFLLFKKFLCIAVNKTNLFDREPSELKIFCPRGCF